LIIRLFRFARLAAAERWLLIVTVLVMASYRLGLWLFPIGWVVDLDGGSQQTPNTHHTRWTPHQVAWAIDIAVRYVPGATCLVRALTAMAVLELTGVRAKLQLGVRKTDAGCVEAHAWVETDGAVIVGAGDLERYSPLIIS
jgi:hypothetical protein